jgi:hypothetical protein
MYINNIMKFLNDKYTDVILMYLYYTNLIFKYLFIIQVNVLYSYLK